MPKRLIRERNGAGGQRTTVDTCLIEPKAHKVANCIKARERGVETFKQSGNGVIEWTESKRLKK